ncbi:hypothetical protein QCA50_000968 [Cerrena zonata]|uniref:BTB domain-containing protein n=1 Tax=Cerrena zonata TaxID=2478898 RepID=A0AAW0GVX6_9APHY
MAAFGESIDPTAAISAILGTYPFSIGLLREILQNSDDAKASKQIFILDRRNHSKQHIAHEALQSTQGPALIAFNDSLFKDEDWVALQRIHQSSKKTDTSKIGKYGVGFRSSYHITDTPQILSGGSLAILDPHHAFSESGGLRVDVTTDTEAYIDHFASLNLNLLAPTYTAGAPFIGTAIRLPLRLDVSSSRISTKVLDPDEIMTLLVNFVEDEMDIAMLFLSHISSIEIFEVDESGIRIVGRTNIHRTSPILFLPGQSITTCTVSLQRGDSRENIDWTILHATYDLEECADILTERLGYQVSAMLAKEKLSPTLSLAIRATLPQSNAGRLFTFLPLPLPTGFPCHIHALFALTQARQNLRNGSERGMVKGTIDELLPEWNRVLFDVYIPRTWSVLLTYLSRHIGDSLSIYNAWPPTPQDASGGDPEYWNNLPVNVLLETIRVDAAIWPCIPEGVHCFSSRSEVLFGTEITPYVSTLSDAGVYITVPPPHIVDMIRNVGEECVWLSPQSARHHLLNTMSTLVKLPPYSKAMLVEFLLSTADVSTLADIPIIPCINGEHVALLHRAFNHKIYVMLSEGDQDVFGLFDPKAISLSSISPSARSVLVSEGPKNLDVSILDVDTVLRFLNMVPSHFGFMLNGLSLTAEATRWINNFWTWLPAWPLQELLLDQICGSKLIPTAVGSLQAIQDIVFDPYGVDSDVLSILMKAGLNFLSKSFPSDASAIIRRRGTLFSPDQLSALLEHLQPTRLEDLTQAEGQCLLRHLLISLRKFPNSVADMHKSLLRALPVFPLLNTTSEGELGASTSKLQCIRESTAIYCFDVSAAKTLDVDRGTLLPFSVDFIFVAHRVDDIDVYPLLDLLGTIASPITKVSELDIVDIFINNLTEQPKPYVVALLQQLSKHSSSIPPRIFDAVSRIPFVVTVERSPKAPRCLIDIWGPLVNLFDPFEIQLPATDDSLDRQIVQHLSVLGLLRRDLHVDIVEERLNYLSYSLSPNVTGLAIELLHQLDHAAFDHTSLASGFNTKWLPTVNGRKSPSETRDDHYNHPRALFDRVWATLLPNITIKSQSLRTALGWTSTIPFEILQVQFVRELDQGTMPSMSPRLEVLIRELGRRVVELRHHPVLTILKEVVATRSWLPISQTTLSSTCRAVLDFQFVPRGFYAVPVSLLGSPGVRELLLLLGCTAQPRPSAVIEELRAIASTSSFDLDTIVELLRVVSHTKLERDEYERLLAPDIQSGLRPLNELYYNDLGAGADCLELPEDRSNCHTAISSSLAARLGIQTLSSLNLKAAELDIDDEDMHEDLTRRISNVLKQYSVEQAFNEFLANAADAGASKYNILVDSKTAPANNLLSPLMSEMQSLPALVVHNDATFQDHDFKGIRTIGTGGKEGRSDTIGKFGLGALSVFHFTEVAMIISGGCVLFLDPSQKFLPANGLRKRRSVLLPLSRMRMLHRDHLLSLAGLFGFDPDSDFYSGTLFRLPLRTSQQGTQSALSHDVHTINEVNNLIANYWKSAPESLLFIQVRTIAAWGRDRYGSQHRRWLTKATHSAIDLNEDGFTCYKVTISLHPGTESVVSHDWHLVSRTVAINTIPAKFHEFTTKHQLRNISISVAGPITTPSALPHGHEPSRCRLYSRLPLPTLSSLPAHIDASWILAEDRRSVRFDESGQVNLESQYNRWILTEGLPDVYGLFLESWPNTRNLHVWPGYPSTPEDPISRVFLEAFFKDYLKASKRSLVTSITGRRMSFVQSIFPSVDSSEIRGLINILKPDEVADITTRRILSKLPSDSTQVINAEFMGTFIKRDSSFQTTHRSGVLSVQEISIFLKWMLDHSPPALIGLQVLPLADKTLGTIREGGSLIHGATSIAHPPWPLFPSNRFLDPGLDGRMFYGRNLNVERFSGTHVVSLLQERLPATSKRTLSTKEAALVKTFWTNFTHLPIHISNITEFPLIQTSAHSSEFASLTHCKSGSVLTSISDPTTAAWLQPMLEHLGATILDYHVIQSTLPAAARSELANLGSTFAHLLNFLRTLGISNIPTRLRALVSPESLSQFATFSREKFASLQKAESVRSGRKKKNWKTVVTITQEDVARQLPIWLAIKDGKDILVHANDSTLRMLPSSLALRNAKPYLNPSFSFVNYDTNLTLLPNVNTITLSDMSNFAFPTTIDEQDIAVFKDVLNGILLYSSTRIDGLKIPNQNGVFVDPTTLYAHSVDIFREALVHHSEYFLHSELRSSETKLGISGLRRVVDFSAFKKCAQIIQEDHGRHPDGSEDRARVVFDFYNRQLWSIIGGNSQKWAELNNISFIPRSVLRRSHSSPSFAPSEWAKDLPTVVNPSQLVRPGYEPIAWTQRGLFPTGLSEQVLLANPTIGAPTAHEVVDHLCRLRFIAQDHKFDKCLAADFTATYKWLQTNLDDAQAPLITYRDEPIFLNVDRVDPAAALDWTFVSASRLIFNGPDEGERRQVRVYLSQFKDLLVAVGAKEVKNAVRPILQLSPAEEILKRFRAAFDDQRRNEQFTDVVLKSSDDEEFVAHRTILAAASPHFEILFTGPWSETRGDVKVVPVPDVCRDILKCILDYIYTGTLQDLQDQDDLKELLELSDLWDMRELFSIIENQLISTITLDTCEQVLEIGTLYHAKDLVKACESFKEDNAHILNPA